MNTKEKVVVIDNYDSFTYNIVHILCELLGKENVEVVRNDAFELSLLNNFDKIILSPGPGIPDEAGKMKEVIKNFSGKKPILGVCLGHQGIGEVFGASLTNLKEVLHGVKGKLSIKDKASPIFNGIPDHIQIGHYHSWVINPNTLPETLQVLAVDEYDNIMAVKHSEYEVYGLQFHPESILTEYGIEIIKNWLFN
ncbi:MAG: aminodeoxychorismate/anthranilate synthase component II [Cyclobacteriaceae bacterium]|nr:aminodeoxychorismate/anthranilate synthase component II [Cyclobacteriaceae bacterium]